MPQASACVAQPILHPKPPNFRSTRSDEKIRNVCFQMLARNGWVSCSKSRMLLTRSHLTFEFSRTYSLHSGIDCPDRLSNCSTAYKLAPFCVLSMVWRSMKPAHPSEIRWLAMERGLEMHVVRLPTHKWRRWFHSVCFFSCCTSGERIPKLKKHTSCQMMH